MRILLNTTSEELNCLGGDFTLYRDWLRLNRWEMNFAPVPCGPVRRVSVPLRKVLEKSCGTWQPRTLRRLLLLMSRYLCVPTTAAKKADVIFSHLLFPWTFSTLPIVWSSQGISPPVYYERYNSGQWKVEDVAFIYETLGRKADALVIWTEACARNVVKWCPQLAEKVHVVPPPVFVDANQSLSKPSTSDGNMRLLFVGIDAARKGLAAVVEAFKILKGRHPRLQLDVISRPDPPLRAKIDALDGARLHYSSFKINVKELMAEADIFVLPTYADTYALAGVEAMAHGCAVIISDLEPLPEVMPDGEVGFAIAPGDVAALVSKVDTLLTKPDLLREFQANARRRYVVNHSPDIAAKKLSLVFEKVIRQSRRDKLGTIPS